MLDNKIPLSILVASLVIGASIYAGLNFRPQSLRSSIPAPTVVPSLSPTSIIDSTQESTQNSSPTTVPTYTPSDDQSIKNILITQTGINTHDMEFTISENNGTIARGGVRDTNSISGAMWFAAKVNDEWEVTYTGQGVPKCSQVNPYNYPTSWADYCLDEFNNTVAR